VNIFSGSSDDIFQNLSRSRSEKKIPLARCFSHSLSLPGLGRRWSRFVR